ncbi:hypothetical protein [Aliikangiella sp. IMCC44359]|uniref:hypothetical protein n=1 Tax=Aliikangiella sp. IMCC44359 TaxID=3459125 RepID=UPI00403AF2F7
MNDASALIKQRLKDYQLKPLLPVELPQIKLKLDDPNSSTDSFKNLYSRDPIFCLYLLSEGWKATKHKSNHPFAADHAMSTIGLGGAQKCFNQLNNSSSINLSQEVTFCLSSSLLAGELANSLGHLNQSSNQRYWTALFYYLPDTLLWYLKPKSMWHIYYRQLTRPTRLKLFEEAKLGFNLKDWRQAVAKELHLSEQCQQVYSKELPSSPKELLTYTQSGYSDDTPSLESWHKQEAWLIVLANRLARAILAPWHTRSFQHTFKLIQQQSGADSKKIKHAISQAIRQVSNNLIDSKLPNPGVGYLLNSCSPPFPDWLVKPKVDKKRLNSINAKKLSSKQASTTNVKKSSISVLIKKLTKNAGDFRSSTELVHDGLNGLIDIVGYDRTAFLIVNYKFFNAQTKVAIANPKKRAIKPDFSFKEAIPLNCFLEKQAFISFSHEKHKKIWHKLPTEILRQGVSNFVFCSLKPGKKVRALIYFDSSDQTLFNQAILNEVKKLLKAMNKGLTIRNEMKRTKTV